MSIKDAIRHYQEGTATAEEAALVEEELEKVRLLNELLEEPWEDSPLSPVPPFEEDASQKEMKKLKKRLRRRNWALILTCLVLVVGLLLGALSAARPTVEAMEQEYWDPTERTTSCQYVDDLELTMAAFTELFIPERRSDRVSASRTGFATYELTIRYQDLGKGDAGYTYGTVEKGKISIPQGTFGFCTLNAFERASYPAYPNTEEGKQYTYDKLSSLPEYINVQAAVSFSKDLSMEELLSLQEEMEGAHIRWIGIRNSPEDQQLYPLIGITPFENGYIYEGINEDYPYFNIKGESITPETLHTHFTSLLEYSRNQEAQGKGLSNTPGDYYYIGADYYDTVLSYVEETGLHSYGCYITGSPKAIMELLDSGVASSAWITDAWIDI